MSKIEKELNQVTEVDRKAKEENQAYFLRLILAVNKLSDEEWNGLSEDTQKWFNDAADASAAKQELPNFPDAEVEKEEAPTRRRTAKSEPESEKKEAKVKNPEVGDTVVVITKRGKTYEGEVLELDKSVIVVKDAKGEEQELNLDRVESITVSGGSEEEKVEGPASQEPKVGDSVKAVTKRGKTYEGEVLEIEEGLVVVKTDEGEEELQVDRLESLTITTVKVKPEEKTSTHPRAVKSEEKEEKTEKPKRTTSAENGGVSTTQRAREIICDDFDLSKEDMLKQMKKEGLTFRDTTIDLVYAETHKVIKILKEAGKLKK